MHYPYSICGKVLLSKAGRTNHRNAAHPAIKANECPLCTKTFHSKKIALQHYKQIHNKIKTVCKFMMCTKCDNLIEKRDWNKHQLEHEIEQNIETAYWFLKNL
jgi:hypothetical protein